MDLGPSSLSRLVAVEQELRTKCLGGCTPETGHPCTLCRFEECSRLGSPGGFVQDQKLGLSH